MIISPTPAPAPRSPGDGTIIVTASQLSGCATRIAVHDGALTVTATQITDCATGITFGTPQLRNAILAPAHQIPDTTITHATIGLDAHQARATLVRTQVLGAAACELGETLEDGSLNTIYGSGCVLSPT